MPSAVDSRATGSLQSKAFFQVASHATDIQSQCTQAEAHPRFSRPDEDSRRASGAEAPSFEGTRTTHRLRQAPPGLQGHPWEARLRGPASFKAVFGGRRLHSGSFTLTWIPSQNPTARLGLVVSRRTSKRSVDRNRLKRLVRESFRKVRLTLGGLDIVITAKREAVNVRGADLLDELAALWARLPACSP
jgi:ribonuclease P protein component